MLTIDDYCDRAKTLNDLKSDTYLAKSVGVNQSVISSWRTKRSWPGDDVMIRVAKLAGLDPTQSLLYLNIWRNDGETNRLYSHLADDYLKNNEQVLKQMISLK